MFDINEFDLFYDDEETYELDEMVGAPSDEVLVACLNKLGRVDIEQMSKSSGKTCEQLVLDLRGSAIFQGPAEFEFDEQWSINKGWQLRSQYCCGNIHRKLAIAERVNAKFPGCFESNIIAPKKCFLPRCAWMKFTYLPVHRGFRQTSMHSSRKNC